MPDPCITRLARVLTHYSLRLKPGQQVLLQTIDSKWREHLLTLEHLRSVIGFRSYAQRDPLNEYKTEAFQLFDRHAFLDEGIQAKVLRHGAGHGQVVGGAVHRK